MTDSEHPSYDDEEFHEVLFLKYLESDDYVGTHAFALEIGCTMQTANRRLLALAKDGAGIDVYDPEAGDGERGKAVDPDTIDPNTARELGFRLDLVDSETAPDYLDTGNTIL